MDINRDQIVQMADIRQAEVFEIFKAYSSRPFVPQIVIFGKLKLHPAVIEELHNRWKDKHGHK